MYLSVTQLENNDMISTSVRINRDMILRGVRLGIFKTGTPNGTLTLVIKDGSTTLGTIPLAISAINDAVGTHFHGYVLFELPGSGIVINKLPTQTYKELTFEITLSAHTDGSSYISLVRSTPTNEIVPGFGDIFSEYYLTDEQLLHFQPYKIELYAI